MAKGGPFTWSMGAIAAEIDLHVWSVGGCAAVTPQCLLFQSLLTGYLGLSRTPASTQAPKTVPPQPVGRVGQGKAATTAANSLAKASVKAAPANSSSSDSSDSDTDIDQVAANHKAGGSPLARLGICLAQE